MSGAFQYKPKFVDIRIRPPKPEEDDPPRVSDLKPGEKPCDWPGCKAAGTAKAPKSREHLNEHYLFCARHAGEYNRNWNFFEGMTEAQMAAAHEARLTGDRPTWQFKASRFSREAAAFAAKFGSGAANKGAGQYQDPFGIFRRKSADPAAAAESSRRLGRIERKALSELDLDDTADGPRIRARYAELVKLCHPDANGGDRSAEQRLQRVLRAYKALQQAKLV
jgi:hypothetical protein